MKVENMEPGEQQDLNLNIEKISKTNARVLEVGSASILQIHPLNFVVPELRILNASSNLLRFMPQHLAQLKNIINIDLSNNLIETIPHSIFPKLQDLHLYQNKLVTIPHDLGILLLTLPPINNPFLIRLEAEQNHIKSIIHPIIAPKLSIISLWSNDFTSFSLPPNSNLSGLDFLDLRINRIRRLPRQTFQCFSSIHSLYLTHNEIALIPYDISTLTPQLHDLWVGENALLTFPPSLSQLTELQTVFAAFNHIRHCPPLTIQNKQIQHLKKKDITTSSQQLNPHQQHDQQNSTTEDDDEADVDNEDNNSHQSPSPPPSITPQTINVRINLTCNLLRQMPEISSDIESFAADRNKITGIAAPFPKRRSLLSFLSLRFNRLRAVPPSLFRCRSISILFLSGNQLQSIDSEDIEWMSKDNRITQSDNIIERQERDQKKERNQNKNGNELNKKISHIPPQSSITTTNSPPIISPITTPSSSPDNQILLSQSPLTNFANPALAITTISSNALQNFTAYPDLIFHLIELKFYLDGYSLCLHQKDLFQVAIELKNCHVRVILLMLLEQHKKPRN
ncbi:MAG: hypothetical protein EZS28_017713 [Streblomastix strix]|uniref:Uncharacterized protein n=1 Tax=Streblomastix strix TaxID=222440 RepID=A0A5J4VWB5_9EUKA|nr:MAG: hypothetical protein EZS28_017713 [Streblomastix strix]